ncbi:hypothetical protein [Actinophytocola xanthii]|uniref:Integral membrane protein n=1 Tax=Actinophytocola xanthii TaxID=1912961 RepID=A0A1Q8BU85_9PSEU|nr:hypothetical protein [Actinophytocola xanthii]OLF05666.1 hypothetical protein BU204_36950 [Actinophytocola xanthii]
MFRTAFATVLVLLGCLLAGPAVAAYFLVDQVTNRDSYLEAVTPLAEEPAVQTAVGDQLTTAVNEQVPEGARPLVGTTIRNFVASEDFRATWVELNKEVHPQLLAMLRRDESGALEVEGDAVVLELGVMADKLKSRFVAEGVPLADRIPEIDARVEVLSGPAVRQAIPAFDLLETLSTALPIAAIALIVLGVALSARRGTTLVVAGIGLVVAMLLVVLARWLLRSEVAARSPSPELAGPFYDALTGRLTVVLWVVCGIGGVLVILGAVLSRRALDRPPADDRRYAPYRG